MVAELRIMEPVTRGFQWTAWPKEFHEEHIELLRRGNDGSLPDWAMQADLVFLADQANHPSRPVRFPGRAVLRRRWGVSDWATRKALADEAWQDTCRRFKIPLPARMPQRSNQPGHQPPTNQVSDHPGMDEPEESHRNQPGHQPPTSQVASTRALDPAYEPKNLRASQTPPTPPPGGANPPSPSDGIPAWARKAAKGTAHTPAQVLSAVVDCLEVAKGRTVNPQRCGTDAAPLLSLWRKLERPPLQAFAVDFKLVSEAARGSPNPLFARDVRGEGWEDAPDRSQSVATLSVQRRWGERLDAAQAWARDGRPSTARQRGSGDLRHLDHGENEPTPEERRQMEAAGWIEPGEVLQDELPDEPDGGSPWT